MFSRDEKDSLIFAFETIMDSHPDRIRELLGYGYWYLMDYADRHRWRGSTLYAYWLGPTNESDQTKVLFDNFRLALEQSDMIDEVKVEPYQEEEDYGDLIGERWFIEFSEYAVEAITRI